MSHLAGRNNNCEIEVRDIRDISAMQGASGAENKERRKEPGAREGVSMNRYTEYVYRVSTVGVFHSKPTRTF